MGELVDRDQEHLKLLKVGFYFLAGTAGFYSLFSLAFIGFGSVIALGAIPAKAGSANDGRVMGTVMLGFGLAFLVIGLAFTCLTYYTARSLAARRRWILCMIVAGMWCLSIPYGTAIGISAILVLNRASVKALFEERATPPAIPIGPQAETDRPV